MPTTTKKDLIDRIADETKYKRNDVRAIVQAFLAVSYKNLRAHETVLDIGCRLLLEKTKKHKSHPTKNK